MSKGLIYILLIAGMGIAPRAFAGGPWQIASEVSPFANDEVYDEYEDQDIAESEAEWLKHPSKELYLGQGDRRNGATHAALLGLGEAALWTTVSVRWLEWLDENLAWSVDLGVGRFPAGTIDSKYSFVTSANSVGGRMQWWPSQTFPMGLSGDLGVHQWTVKAKCGSGMPMGHCNDGLFKASGVSAGSGILLSWLAEDEIVIEWFVMGFKYSKIFNSTWSGGEGDPDLQGESRGTIAGGKLVSFTNFAVGWRF